MNSRIPVPSTKCKVVQRHRESCVQFYWWIGVGCRSVWRSKVPLSTAHLQQWTFPANDDDDYEQLNGKYFLYVIKCLVVSGFCFSGIPINKRNVVKIGEFDKLEKINWLNSIAYLHSFLGRVERRVCLSLVLTNPGPVQATFQYQNGCGMEHLAKWLTGYIQCSVFTCQRRHIFASVTGSKIN